MNSLSVGQLIKNYRNRLKVSQFELEIELDMSPGSISRIETGKVDPGKRTLIKIAKFLRLSKEEVLSLFGFN